MIPTTTTKIAKRSNIKIIRHKRKNGSMNINDRVHHQTSL